MILCLMKCSNNNASEFVVLLESEKLHGLSYVFQNYVKFEALCLNISEVLSTSFIL